MKRFFLSVCIAFAILVHFALAYQSPGQTDDSLYIVVLKYPSVAEKVVEMTPGLSSEERRRFVETPAISQYRKDLQIRQREFVDRLGRIQFLRTTGTPLPSMEVLDRQSEIINSLLITATPKQAEALSRREDVKGVYPNSIRYPLLDAAPALVGAPEAWLALGGAANAGVGIKIGIIDSGINIEHPMFIDPGLPTPAGFPLGTTAFTNSKVIVARNFVSTRYGLQNQRVNTPEDELGHGSRVAAIAAGAPNNAPLGFVQGIAPRAYLGSYKVFGDPSINETTTSAAVIAALNQAIQDKMDVLNLSLGGPARNPSDDPEQQAIANATALGVIVVVAAGNAGPDPGTVKSPGTSPAAITVGATSNARNFGGLLELSAVSPALPASLKRLNYVPGTGNTAASTLGPLPIVSITALDPSEEACSPLRAGSLRNQIALVKRGSCFFSVKATNVLQIAEAAAMVVYNNVEGPAITMDFGETPPTRPAVMIEKVPGEQLRDFLKTGVTTRATVHLESSLFPFPAQADVVASFSSRGPSIDQSLKPDLSAPGQNMYTASNTGTEYARGVNGTSFATPVVAGAAALLRQLHPQWTAAEIKSSLVNSASKTVTIGGETARVTQAGNGRLDLSGSVRQAATLNPVSLSFGQLTDNSTQSLKRSLTVTNKSATARSFAIDIDYTFPNPSMQLQVSPASLTLGGGQTARVELTAQPTAPLKSGAFEGYVRFTDVSGGIDLTASFWGALTAEDNGGTLQVSQNSSAPYTTIGAALAVAQPGDVIEIIDSSTYLTAIKIGFNSQGLELNGLTLRAAPGQSPVIDATSMDGEEATIQVTDLSRVTIEGLTVRGLKEGIRFTNSTGAIRNNRIEAHAAEPGVAINLTNSQVHVFGNTIQNNSGGGIRAVDAATLVQQNTIGDGSNGNGGGGISATRLSSDSPLAIFDNIIAGNGSQSSGAGISVSNQIALIKGNIVTLQQGQSGDGIRVLRSGASALIQDNRIEANDRNGVSIEEGASASLVGNSILRNAISGLSLQSASAAVHSSIFDRNNTGLSLNSGALELSNSLVTNSVEGDGLNAGGGSLSVTNTTFFGNRDYGIRLGGTSSTISNTIFSANNAGDLAGQAGGTVTFNLFQNNTLSGSNGNFSENPGFDDPVNFNFSLRNDSAAIDQGNSQLAFSDADLFYRQRVVDGDGDGVAQVDVGAVEFNSPHASPIILPVLSTSAGDFLGLALANTFGSPVSAQSGNGVDPHTTTVQLKAYDRAGVQYSTVKTLQIGSGRQLSILLRDVLGPLKEGWVQILPSNPDLMAFTLFGSNDLRFLDGSELASRLARKLVFPEVRGAQGESTALFVVNPHSRSVNLILRWIRTSGTALEKSFTLPALGSLSMTVQQIFGTGSGGYILVDGSDPVSGLEIFGTADSKGGLLALDFETASQRLLAAHAACSGSLITRLNLINTGPVSDNTLFIYDETGALLKSTTTRLNAGGSASFDLCDVLGSTGADISGWVEIRSVAGKLLGNVTFGENNKRFLAALPLQSSGGREFVLSHVAQTADVFTGITLLNSSSRRALVSVEVFRPSGELTGVDLLELEPGQKIAQLLPDLIEAAANQSGGFIRVRSNENILGFELFGNVALTFLSSVPQQVVVR